MSTWFLDLEAGNDASDGTTFANRKKTLAGASAVALPGDTVKIMASTTPNSLGTNGTFAKGSPTITLAAAQNATIENCETAWTASANVTTTTSTTRKQGSLSTSIAPAAGFTTGLVAFKLITLADLSAYQQISFWFQQTAGTLSGFDIKICTDVVGAVAANTFSIPAPVVLNGWNRVTVNLGSAMSAAALSIGFYVTADNGAQTYIIDNIVACKAPGTGELSHKTLIGKAKSLGAGGDDSETWYAIRAIEGTTITLDLLNSSNAGSTTNGRYWGTSETVTAYSLFPSYVPTSVVSADLQWTAGGTDQATLTISGGWNRTDMTTQTGQTWLAVGNAPSTALQMTWEAHYLDISKLNFVFASTSNPSMEIANTAISTMHVVGSVGFIVRGMNTTLTGIVISHNTGTVQIAGVNVVCDLKCYQCVTANFASAIGCSITLYADSICLLPTPSAASKLIFSGTTYGGFGEASAAAAVRTNLTTELATITHLDTALALNAGAYRYTAAALALAPSGGGGGDATAANQTTIINAIAAVQADTDNIQTRIPAALVSGRMDSVVPDTQKVDVNTLKTQAVTCAAPITVLASVGTAATNTAQTGDSFARIGAAGAELTAIGDARLANLDAAISSRGTSTLTQTQVTGGAYSIQSASAVLGDARIANLDATVSSRGTSTYAGGAVASVTAAITLPTIPTNWITADGIATDAFGALELAAGAGSEIASAVRTELATELARIDAAITTRMATFTVPTNFAALGINASGHVSRVTLVDTTTTNTDMRGTNSALLAASYTAPPTAAQVRAEIDSNSTQLAAIVADTNELQTDWHNGGRLDTILDAAGGGDVTLAAFGSSALAQLAALDTIVITGAVVRSGLINGIVIGRDYLATDGQQLQFVNEPGSWPNLTGATIALKLVSLDGTLSFSGSVVTASGLNQRCDVALTAAQTAMLTLAHSGYRLEATLSNGHLVRLESGRAVVTE